MRFQEATVLTFGRTSPSLQPECIRRGVRARATTAGPEAQALKVWAKYVTYFVLQGTMPWDLACERPYSGRSDEEEGMHPLCINTGWNGLV